MEKIRSENALNIPNALTMLRIVLMPVVVRCFLRGEMRSALIVYLTAMLSDAVDGIIARKLNQTTSIGKLLDPIADKVSLFTLLALFVSDGQIPVSVAAVLLAKDTLLILGSIAALRMGIVVSALPIGKLTTVLFVLSMALRLASLRVWADVLLGLAALLSLAALMWYGAVLLKQIPLHHEPVAS